MAFKEKRKYWNTVAPEDEEDLGRENYALLEFVTPKHYKIYYFFFFQRTGILHHRMYYPGTSLQIQLLSH